MNKKSNNSLTGSDKELLRLLNSRFELARQITGGEPLIYFEFGIQPDSDTDITTPLMERRQGVFNKIVEGNPKKIS